MAVCQGVKAQREGEGVAAALERVTVWHVDIAPEADALLALEAGTPRLAAGDYQRAATLGGGDPHHPQARERRAVYVALRIALEHAFGAAPVRGRELQRSQLGRPSLAGCPGDFSLAHVAGHALIGVVRHGSVGVDIERRRNIRMPPARRAAIERAAAAIAFDSFKPQSLAQSLAQSPAPPPPCESSDRFLAAWVRLEAFAKAQRVSLARVLTAAGALGGARPDSDAALQERLQALQFVGPHFDANRPEVSVRGAPLGADLFGAVAWAGCGVAKLSAEPVVVRPIAAVAGLQSAVVR